MSYAQLSPQVRRAITQLGTDLTTARKKRRLSQRDLAKRMGVSLKTISRLEHGDPGIGIGTLAMAFLSLGCLDRFTEVLDPSGDNIGLVSDQQTLPKRVRKKRAPKSELTGQPIETSKGMDL